MNENSNTGQTAGSFSCPRCGFEQSAAVAECARCGVVFAKLLGTGLPARSPSTRPAEARTRGSFVAGLLLMAAAGGLVILLFPRSQPPAPKSADQEKLAKAAAPVSASKVAVTPPPPPQISPPRFPPPEFQQPTVNVSEYLSAAPPPQKRPAEMKRARLPYTWYEGSQGYQSALQEADEVGLPVAVYFYTDWCPYCRQLEREILITPQVMEYFAHVVKVRINPEDGPEEQGISDSYGVTGYPSFFVQPSATGGAVKIHERDVPADFVASCQSAAQG